MQLITEASPHSAGAEPWTGCVQGLVRVEAHAGAFPLTVAIGHGAKMRVVHAVVNPAVATQRREGDEDLAALHSGNLALPAAGITRIVFSAHTVHVDTQRSPLELDTLQIQVEDLSRGHGHTPQADPAEVCQGIDHRQVRFKFQDLRYFTRTDQDTGKG